MSIDSRCRQARDVVDGGLVKRERLQLHLSFAWNVCARCAERGFSEQADGTVECGVCRGEVVGCRAVSDAVR